MKSIYKHTQVGYAILVPFAGVVLLYLVFVLPTENGGKTLLVLAPIALIILFFSTLTIEVTGEEVRWSYGPRVRAQRVALSRIVSTRVVRTSWYYGWGVRLTPRGMLYNVSGTGAVEIELKSGTAFSLGSDEPERLRDAVEAALREHGRAG
jgi:hypothetical protein